MRTVIILITILFMPILGYSATYYVPDDYGKIQEAIDASLNGDTVIVRPDTYKENISFNKAITVRSEKGYDETVIDGGKLGEVVHFNNAGPSSVLKGFTITNGNNGGIYCFNSNATISDNHIAGNSAGDGGGMYLFYSGPTVTNCIFEGNSATIGGGIKIDQYSSPTVTSCSFIENSAWKGGGIYNFSDWPPPTVSNCTFSKNSATYGGGILNEYGESVITDCTFTENSAVEYGGGMENYNSSNSTMNNCTFSGNSAKFGGGLLNNNSSWTITDCTFINNSADEYGGGMEDYNSSSSTVTRCIFSGNSAKQGGGMLNNTSSPNLYQCTFNDNSASFKGGGMFNLSSSPQVTCCTFMGNSSTSSGGGMNNESSGSPKVIHCTFINNSVTGEGAGGGMYNDCVDATVINCIFSGNYGIYGGGGMGNHSSDPAVTNCTFSGNAAKSNYSGGGMSNTYGSPEVTNCIFWNDTPDEFSSYMSSPIVNYCCIEGGWPGGIGNIDDAPLFVDSANGDFHLTFPSPCRNTGNNAAPGLEAEDFEGDPRIADGTVDMGADEFYIHLYLTGDATPGGSVALKFVGFPYAPVLLWLGSGVMDPPMQTKYGDWRLQFPLLAQLGLGSIPYPDGVLVFPFTLPPDTPAPLSLPFQAGIGMELTNLCLMEID